VWGEVAQLKVGVVAHSCLGGSIPDSNNLDINVQKRMARNIGRRSQWPIHNVHFLTFGMRMRGWIIGTAICGLSSFANAAPLSVYGLEFGKPLAFPECIKVRGSSEYTYARNQPEQPVCGLGASPSENVMDPAMYVGLNFPASAKPALSKGNTVYVELIDGNLESVLTYTGGVDTQAADEIALTEKYGKPSSSKYIDGRLIGSPSARIIAAEWYLEDGSKVLLLGGTRRPNEGLFRIQSTKALKAEAAETERKKTEALKRSTPL
jgi:hypothetical protein